MHATTGNAPRKKHVEPLRVVSQPAVWLQIQEEHLDRLWGQALLKDIRLDKIMKARQAILASDDFSKRQSGVDRGVLY